MGLVVRPTDIKGLLPLLICQKMIWTRKKNLVPPGLEPGTFRVLSERDNHYTMELMAQLQEKSIFQFASNLCRQHWMYFIVEKLYATSNVLYSFKRVIYELALSASSWLVHSNRLSFPLGDGPWLLIAHMSDASQRVIWGSESCLERVQPPYLLNKGH